MRVAHLLRSTILMLAPVIAGATEPTAFTTQGFLASGGVPFSGLVDLEAELFDDATGGTQLGTTQLVVDHPVVSGRFALELDFGEVYFGTPVWLELRVRPVGSPTFATLHPRQRLRSVPHTAYAHTAWLADLALNTGTVNGTSAADLLDWNQMTGVPADLADGDDDTAGSLLCSEGQIALWNGSAWNCADDAGVSFGRTFVVGPVGDPVANGSALLAAMAAIPTPGSAADAWLLKIEPGRYDLGTQTLQMKSRVDVEGSGRQATVVASAVCDSIVGTVAGAADTELRGLTVENLCADPVEFGCGVSISEDHFSVDDVLIRCIGATFDNTGVCASADWLTITKSRINVSNASDRNTGIFVDTHGGLEIHNLVAEATGNSHRVDGSAIRINSGGSGPAFGANIEGCIFRASSSSPSTTAHGLTIEKHTALEVTVSDSKTTAMASPLGYGLWTSTNEGLLRVTRVEAHGGTVGIFHSAYSMLASQTLLTDVSMSGSQHGLYLRANVGSVHVDGGVIQGATASVTDGGFSGGIAHISNARLIGPTSFVPSTLSTCTAVTDGTPTFYPSTCP